MMAWLSAGFVRSWARLYTLGLDPEVRRQRRAEIDSDIWEHIRAGRDEGERPFLTGLHLVARTLAGIPGDVTWRVRARGFVAAPDLILADALVAGRRRRMRHRRRWSERHAWVWPAAIVLTILGGMYWLTSSTTPTKVTFNLEAPEHLTVTHQGLWQWHPLGPDGYSRFGPEVIPGFTQSHTLTVANHSQQTAWVRIEGLPEGYTYSLASTVEAAVTRGEHVVIPPRTIAEVEVTISAPSIRSFGASRDIGLRLVDDARLPDQ